MKKPLLAGVAILALGACGDKTNGEATGTTETAPVSQRQSGPVIASAEKLNEMRAQIAVVDMNPDVSFLTEAEREVINLLNEAGDLMSEIYLRQRNGDNPSLRTELAESDAAQKALALELFDLHFGPWDTLGHNAPFVGETPMPEGAGFYPSDITKEEFASWIEAHPEDKDAFTSGYTIIKRQGDGLVAVPYSVEYAEWLAPASDLLREAAEVTENENLATFLNLRADAFTSDDYYQSELAWMDLDGPIEVAIGPYEVYTDGLYGYKTAFEAFVTVKNPEESAALAKYKDFLRDMEANLPVDEGYKNFKRGFASPIAVTYQVHGGGDNVPGVQTIAFNLPNDERVREAKGAKKVLLNNVLGAKFDLILQPMAEDVLVPEQAAMLVKKYMSMETLFHELAHSLGPGSIIKDGVETSVSAELKELYTGTEEGKADVMGAYNILYMMERGELPIAEKESFLATYYVGLFRAMRFGINEAHGKGAAFQFTYFNEAGAVSWDEDAKKFRIDFAKLEQAISDLTRDVVVLQGNGDYDAAAAFLERYAHLDANAEAVIAALTRLPVDIQPVYKDRL